MTIPGAETVGERVGRVRRRSKLGVRELAEKAGVAAKTVTNIEAGSPARGDTLARIADALDVSLEWLREG